MFEQEYKKMFRDVKPSAELEAETLGLLLELRDHPPAPPAPKRNLKPIFITTAASLAAAFLLTLIGVGFFHGVVKKEEDYFDFADEESIGDDTLFDQNSSTEDSDEDSAPADDAVKNESKEDSTDGSAGTSDQEEETDADSTDEDSLDKSDESPSEEPEDDPLLEEYKESDNGSTVAALCEPKKVNTGGIRTYLSVKEFADALEKRSTLGYGNRYYNARELLIVPSKLPDCSFRQLYLDTKTGAYTYQYSIPVEADIYYLTVENKSARATTLQQLKEQISYLEGEEVAVSRDGNTATYTFGTETVTVTLTLAATGSSEIAPETVEQVFNAFDLTRSTLDNKLLEMTYENQ